MRSISRDRGQREWAVVEVELGSLGSNKLVHGETCELCWDERAVFWYLEPARDMPIYILITLGTLCIVDCDIRVHLI
jgi:hypothetical protein